MPSGEPWRPHGSTPALAADEVHVWRAWLDVEPDEFTRLAVTLAPDERGRSSRFRFVRDRRRFITARGILRHILARYVGRDPAALRFRYGPAGKPTLAYDSGADDLRFNVSHSHGMALYSLANRRETGVDVEWVQARIPSEPIAERFFSAREAAVLRALPDSARAEAFFTCWTRKEAYVKGRGDGLAVPLDSFDVSLIPGTTVAAPVTVHETPSCATTWRVRGLAPGMGYVGAVAAEGCDWGVRLWQWTPTGASGRSPGLLKVPGT